MRLVDYLVHVSNILLLVSYSVRDILWLRWFAVAAALIVIPYYVFRPDILWPPLLWGLVFTALNLFQIARLDLERRPIVLSADEQKLYDMGFHSLRPREFVSLLLAGQWKDAAAGDVVLSDGKPVASICVAISGAVQVRRHGQEIGVLRPGNLIGAAVAVTGEPSPVDATFAETARYMCWPLHSIRSFLEKKPELRLALQQLVNQDLSRKLAAAVSR
jgi:CRP-like cAMP-binding protein